GGAPPPGAPPAGGAPPPGAPPAGGAPPGGGGPPPGAPPGGGGPPAGAPPGGGGPPPGPLIYKNSYFVGKLTVRQRKLPKRREQREEVRYVYYISFYIKERLSNRVN
ncbi:hypothetical protein C1645_842747, partial [Glomus cerebriforme]